MSYKDNTWALDCSVSHIFKRCVYVMRGMLGGCRVYIYLYHSFLCQRLYNLDVVGADVTMDRGGSKTGSTSMTREITRKAKVTLSSGVVINIVLL